MNNLPESSPLLGGETTDSYSPHRAGSSGQVTPVEQTGIHVSWEGDERGYEEDAQIRPVFTFKPYLLSPFQLKTMA